MSSSRVITIMTNLTGTGVAAIAGGTAAYFCFRGAIKNIESLVRDTSYQLCGEEKDLQAAVRERIEDELPEFYSQLPAQAEPDRNQTPASLVLRTSIMTMTLICSIYATAKLAAPMYNALAGDDPEQNLFAAMATGAVFVNLPAAAIWVSDPLAKKVKQGIKALSARFPLLSGCASFFNKNERGWDSRDVQNNIELQSLADNVQKNSPA